jgi:hypothetical protein
MSRPSHRRALLEDIEPRILYAADHPAAAAIAPLLMADTTQVDQVPAQTQTHSAAELVFIDERVPDADLLAKDIAAQAAAGRDITVVRIGADMDGIAAITRALNATHGVAAVHVISHGGAGAVQLGASTLDQDALLLHAPEIAAWAGHMSSNADLLLYGCDVAEGTEGQALLLGLAQLTGADVAASTDLTGAAVLGGNWLLEASTGKIEAAGAVAAPGQAAFHGVLASFTVSNTNNSGAGSLRQAIIDANAAGGADTINFAIGAFNSQQTILVASALPALTGATVIDGASQGVPGAHNIILDGGNGNYDGLELTASASGSTVSGLVIRNFGQEGIQIDANSNNNFIRGNYIGQLGGDGLIGPAGSGNRTGILVLGGASVNTLGGATAADRNVISGNDGGGAFEGIGIELNSTDSTTVQGNYIGTDASGNVAVGNVNAGILVRGLGLSSQIGGFGAGEANVIAGNPLHNVWITNAGPVVLFANHIGLGADGSTVLGNSLDGILVEGSVNGGNFTRNVIAGAGRNGIRIDGTVMNLFMSSNRIGTDDAGTANWGSGQDGVYMGNTAAIGGGPSNVVFILNTVAFSGQAGPNHAGVRVDASVTGTNPLLINTIYASSGLGIDIGAPGAQANDLGDADAGANDLQNFPLVHSATITGGQINLSISLNSRPSTTYTIDFFGVPANSADSGADEGNVYLSSIDVTTDANGNVAATTSLAAGALLLGDRVTATATRRVGGGYGGTSEFSAAATIVNASPVITSNGGGASASVSMAENGTAVTTVVAADADSPTLAYSIAGGADEGRFIINASTGALSFATAPDFEAPTDADGNNVYDLIVHVSDGSHTDTQAIAVTVTDVDESPIGPVSDTNPSSNSVAENAANGSPAGLTAHAVDRDGTNNAVSYSLVNSAGGRFAIDASTGVVTVADGTRLDFEAAASHAITVLATSADGSTSSQNFTIVVGNVDEDQPPPPAPPPSSPPPPAPAPEPPPSPPPPRPPVAPIDPILPDMPVVPVNPPLPAEPVDPLSPAPPVPETRRADPDPFTPARADFGSPTPPALAVASGATPGVSRVRLSIGDDSSKGFLESAPAADAFDVAWRLTDVRRLASGPVPDLSAAQQRSPDEDASASFDVDATLVGGIAFSLGLVFWASRGGALLASLLAAAPAWQNFDPLPVLRRRDDGRDIRDIRDPEADAEPETLVPSETGDIPDPLPGDALAPGRRIGADGNTEVRP